MCALVLALTLGLTPPTPPVLPNEPPQPSDDAREYARQLLDLTETISSRYVRPVDRRDLLAAALTGLFDAARKPVPPRIRASLDRAGEDELNALVVRLREEAGSAEELKGHGALLVSLRAMRDVLDPFAVVYDLQDNHRITEPTHNGPGLSLESGPGATTRLRDDMRLPPIAFRPGVMPAAPGPGPWRVASVTPGGPAQRAGLRPGDRITHIDGRPLTGDTSALAQRLFGGESSEPVRVTFRRGNEPEAREAEFTLGTFTQETVWGVRRLESGEWDYLIDPKRKVGLVRVGPINDQTPKDLDKALGTLRAAGATGLLLDLRACPGGYLKQATEVVRRFATDGVIATVKDRRGNVTAYYEAGGSALGEPTCKLPMTLLVGPETVGGGELIAAALQDLKRARVAGQRSAGKAGVMQDPVDLAIPGLAFKLSTDLFIRPSGRNLQRFTNSTSRDEWGVEPDEGLAVPLTPQLARQLQEWWRWQTLRPAGSREALPLDDPENDPVAQAALWAMKK
jgi:C-terminal peptidase prc